MIGGRRPRYLVVAPAGRRGDVTATVTAGHDSGSSMVTAGLLGGVVLQGLSAPSGGRSHRGMSGALPGQERA